MSAQDSTRAYGKRTGGLRIKVSAIRNRAQRESADRQCRRRCADFAAPDRLTIEEWGKKLQRMVEMFGVLQQVVCPRSVASSFPIRLTGQSRTFRRKSPHGN